MLTGSSMYTGGVRPNYSPYNSFLLWFALCYFVMFFPFLVVDLYYAYHDNTCAQNFNGVNNIRITLRDWLQVDGYIILGFIIIFLILGIIACCQPELVCTYGWWEGLHVFFVIWRLTWLIVGAIMFWGGYNKNNTCADNISRYMWAMLIIGFVWLFVELVLAFCYPRPIPYPMSVPMATGGFRSSAVLAPIGGVTTTPVFRPGGILY